MGFLAALFAFFMRPSKKPVQKLGPQGFVPVPHEGRTIWVMPDFHKDKHGMRLPVTGIDALRLAQEKSRAVGFPLTLPTKEMVDSIHKAADVRLLMPTRSDKRQAMATYRSVDAEIETARRGRSRASVGPQEGNSAPAGEGQSDDLWRDACRRHVLATSVQRSRRTLHRLLARAAARL
jgi:hypothetical protein